MSETDMTFDVLIEIPKGSRNKYEYDKVKKVVRYDRMIIMPLEPRKYNH